TGRRQEIEHPLYQMRPSPLLDRPGRKSACDKDGYRLDAGFVREPFEKSADLVVRTGKMLFNGVAFEQRLLFKILQGGGLREKRIGFVQKPDDADAFGHAMLFPISNGA